MNQSLKTDTEEEHKRLRRLILGADYTEKLEDSRSDVERVSEVISEAVESRNKKDNSMGKAFSPALKAALNHAIKKDPQPIINAIFPVIAPALRKAINSAISEMVLSLNQILEKSLSPKSIFWRLQAWQSGKSYAEFVLLKTIKYRVEQVILIDRETSLVMALKTASHVESQDPEQVSAMLSAISDFISESFSSDTQDSLEAIRLGDFVLEIATSPTAILVAAIRGINSVQVKQHLTSTLETLHSNHHKLIQNFNGERLDDEDIDNLLENCLLEQRLNEESLTPKKPWPVIVIVVSLCIAVSTYVFFQWHWQQQANNIINLINAQNDYVLTEQERSFNHLKLSFMRSPLSKPFNQLIKNLDHSLSLETHQSYAPIGNTAFFLPYIKNTLKLGHQQELEIKGNQLIIKGELSNQQIQSINRNSIINDLFEEVVLELPTSSSSAAQAIDKSMQNINSLSIKYVPQKENKKTNSPEVQIKKLIDELNQINILFEFNSISVDLTTSLELQLALKLLKQIKEISQTAKIEFPDVIIMGFSGNTTQNQIINKKVSLQRALFIKRLLEDNDIPAESLMVVAMGSLQQSKLAVDKQRRVTLMATYIYPPSGSAE